MRTGETKTFSHEVPDAWWETDEAVTSVESVVTLKELFQCDVPEVSTFPRCFEILEKSKTPIIFQRIEQIYGIHYYYYS